MNVIQIGNFGPPHSTETHLREALLALGHTVACIQEEVEQGWQIGTEALRNGLPQGPIDAVIWTRTKSLSARVPLARKMAFLGEAHGAGIPVFGVHLDRWWGLQRQSDLTEDVYFTECDVMFTADGGHQEEWASIGVNHIWLPPAVSHVEAAREGVYREDLASSVAFVGSWQNYHDEWPQRKDLVRHLKHHWGRELKLWPKAGEPAVRGQDLCDLYASVDILVGDSCLAPNARGEAPHSYWSDRIPESLGRGGFLLHPWVEGLEMSYEDGLHLRLYRGFDQLDEYIEQYLEDDPARTGIADRGRKHVQANHTYLNRMEEVLSHVPA